MGNVHPLRLLDCDDNLLMLHLAAMARPANREGLTPLRLLGRTSEGDQGCCQLTLPFLPLLSNTVLTAPYLAGGWRQ